MRNTLLTTAAIMGLAFAMPAMAQTPRQPLPANPSAVQDGTPAAGTDTGMAPSQDPAARTNVPGAMSGPPPAQDSTSAPGVPAQASAPANPGSSQPASSADTGAQPDQAAPNGEGMHNNMMRRTHRAITANGSGHWAHQPGTGESGPASERASNIDSADTHSKIAPHFPQPKVGQNASPASYLQDAENALSRHRSGEADQALEMAETRLLDRSTPAADANQADQNPAIQQVANARKALASGDMQAARSAIQTALASANGEGSGAGGGSGMGASFIAPASSQGGVSNGSSNGMSSGPSAGMSNNGAAGTGPAPLSTTAGGAPGAAGAAPAVSAGSGGGTAGAPTTDSAGGAK